MKTITISVINDLVTDQRIHRIAGTLFREGFEVLLIGRELPGSLPLAESTFKVKRFRMLFSKGPFFYASYNFRLFLFLLFKREVKLLISVDLDTLPANYLIGRLRKIPLIYDSHEYFTEVPELIYRKNVQQFWENLERRIVPALKHAITVSDSIAEMYSVKYRIPFITIRNVSCFREPEEDPGFKISYNSKYVIIYQGALNVGRGIELMIRSVSLLEDVMLIIAGVGDISADLREEARKLNLNNKVVFTGRLLPAELYKLTSQCDLGLSIEEDLGLSYRMSLPNKVFDYIQARIPILCSDLPEMSALIREFEIGEVFCGRDEQVLAGQIDSLLRDSSKRKFYRKNLDVAAELLCWEKEQEKLMKIVSEAITI